MPPIIGYLPESEELVPRSSSKKMIVFLPMNWAALARPLHPRTLLLVDHLEQFGPGADALSYSSAVCACRRGHSTAVAVALLNRLDLAWPVWLQKKAIQGWRSWDGWAK